MKKIIVDLLDQYEKDMDMPQFAVQYYTDEYIISKHYGFIKWLVDNDKINKRKLYDDEYKIKIQLDGTTYWELWWADRLLMLLAIQDKPIEFLIRILK